jgi:hypothetical protein
METTKQKPLTNSNSYIVGTKTDKCELCKETKKLLLLKSGYSLCEDCLSICISILQNLQQGEVAKIFAAKTGDTLQNPKLDPTQQSGFKNKNLL